MQGREELFDEKPVTTQHPDYKAEIVELLRGSSTAEEKQKRLGDYHENDIAAALELLEEAERKELYQLLDMETLADIFEYSEEFQKYIGELDTKQKVEVLLQFEISTAVEYLNQMERSERNALLRQMDEERRWEIFLSSSFAETEIGSKMSVNYVAVYDGSSVRQAMRELVKQAADHDNISTIYVIDQEERFVGAIELKKLIIAREGTELKSITMTSYPYVYASEQIEDCMERIKDYSEDSIPVLNSEGKLEGVLTSQEIMQLADEEMGEDYARLAGLLAEEDLREPLGQSIYKRLPWLMILLGLGLLVSSVVGIFEGIVAQLPLIMGFQSLVLDMAGNVGTQSLAVTIRVLMDEQVGGKEKFALIVKEVRVGLVNGLILGSLSFVLIGLYLMKMKQQSFHLSFGISSCTGLALLTAIVLASLSGTVIPLILKKFHVDPAVASGPLITTINDLVAVVTYYGLAWALLLSVL